jgi:hypothetical protein
MTDAARCPLPAARFPQVRGPQTANVEFLLVAGSW